MKPDTQHESQLYFYSIDAMTILASPDQRESKRLFTIEDIKEAEASSLMVHLQSDTSPFNQNSLDILYSLLNLPTTKQLHFKVSKDQNLHHLNEAATDLIIEILNRSHNLCFLPDCPQLSLQQEYSSSKKIIDALTNIITSRKTHLHLGVHYEFLLLDELQEIVRTNIYTILDDFASIRYDYKPVTRLPIEAYNALKLYNTNAESRIKLKPYILEYYNALCIEALTTPPYDQANLASYYEWIRCLITPELDKYKIEEHTVRYIAELNSIIIALYKLFCEMKAIVDHAILCKVLLLNNGFPNEIQTMISKMVLELYLDPSMNKDDEVQIEELEEEEEFQQQLAAQPAPEAPQYEVPAPPAAQAPAPALQHLAAAPGGGPIKESEQSMLGKFISYACEHKLEILGCSAMLIISAGALCRIYSGKISISQIMNNISPTSSLSI